MKKYTLTLVAAATLIASGISMADVTVSAQGGYNLTTKLANQKTYDPSKSDTAGSWQNHNTANNHHNIVFGVNAGYATKVTDNIQVGGQIGYLNFGTQKQDLSNWGNGTYQNEKGEYSVSSQIIPVLATISYGFDNIDIFVKPGVAYAIQNAKMDDSFSKLAPGEHFNVTQHGIKPYVSAGVDYNLDNAVIGVSYEHMFGAKSTKEDTSYSGTAGPGVKTLYHGKILSQSAVMLSLGYKI